ncbi:hypothetical protein, partial [Bifidobacterium reuteri]|uniref:hypothetical protein n=1 Tax=Bifidobacterium reuteri TaxID=983706 RepID=UPI001CC31D7E
MAEHIWDYWVPRARRTFLGVSHDKKTASKTGRYLRAFASLCGGVLSLGVVAGAFVYAGME